LHRIATEDLLGPDRNLSAQLAMIRTIAREIRVSEAVRLDEVLSTYPGDIAPHSPWRRKALGVHRRFGEREQPQALMIGLAWAIDGCRLQTSVGAIECSSDVGMLAVPESIAGPPYLFILAGIIDPARDHIVPLRAFAQPVFSINHLLPVESEDECRLIGAAMNFQRMAIYRFPSLRVTIEKPVFDTETEDGWARPPLLVTVANVRRGLSECFVLRAHGQETNQIRRLDHHFGRTLTLPDDVLARDARAQAGWFVDAIYGMPPSMAPSISSPGGAYAAGVS
jgi:hypothetical protein